MTDAADSEGEQGGCQLIHLRGRIPLKGDLTGTRGHAHCLAAKEPQKWAQSAHKKTHKWVNSLRSSSSATLFLIPKEGPQIHPKWTADSTESQQTVKEQHLPGNTEAPPCGWFKCKVSFTNVPGV